MGQGSIVKPFQLQCIISGSARRLRESIMMFDPLIRTNNELIPVVINDAVDIHGDDDDYLGFLISGQYMSVTGCGIKELPLQLGFPRSVFGCGGPMKLIATCLKGM